MRFRSNFDRTSQSPLPRNRHTGMPIGHPNSTVFMSSPIRFRSSLVRVFNQSRTGSPPASVRKKMAGTRFPCLLPSADTGSSCFGFTVAKIVYHIWYTESRIAWSNLSTAKATKVTKKSHSIKRMLFEFPTIFLPLIRLHGWMNEAASLEPSLNRMAREQDQRISEVVRRERPGC